MISVPWKWFVLFGAFISRVITTGTIVCSGVFLNEFEITFPNWGKAQLAAIFSVAIGLLEGTGIVASLLMRKFESRYLIMLGGILASVGVAMASSATSYWQMISWFGILNGFGQGIARCLMPVAVAHSFDDNDRHIAMSLQNVGDGVGGLIFPLLFAHMFDQWAWRGALLLTAGIVMHLLISGAVVELHLPKSKAIRTVTAINGQDLEKTPLSQRLRRRTVGKCSFLCPNIGFFLLNILSHSIGYYIFMVFIYNELTEVQGIDKSLASAMFACVGGVSILGRLSVSLMNNERVPRWLIYAVMHVVRGLIVLSFNAVPYLSSHDHRVIAYFVLCSAFGITDGITGALIPVFCLDIFGLRSMADVYGYQLFFMGAGALMGPPIAGAMEKAFASSTLPLSFSGISFILAGSILFPLFCTKKHYQIAADEKRQIELKELTSDL